MMNFRKMLAEWIVENKNNSTSLALHKMKAIAYDADFLYVLYNPDILIQMISNSKKLGQWLINFEQKKNLKSLYFNAGLLGSLVVKKHKDCGEAWEVQASSVLPQYQGFGYGKMIYGLVMSDLYDGYIMPDRRSVSDKAKRIWQSMEKNPKIEKWPSQKSPYGGTFDDKFDPQTTPTDDDCNIYNDPLLDKAYRYSPSQENSQLLQQTLKNDESCRRQINKIQTKVRYKDGENFVYDGQYIWAKIERAMISMFNAVYLHKV